MRQKSLDLLLLKAFPGSAKEVYFIFDPSFSLRSSFCYLLQATVPSLQDWLTEGDVFRWKEKASVLHDCIFETSLHLCALERSQIYGAATLLPHKIELWTRVFFDVFILQGRVSE